MRSRSVPLRGVIAAALSCAVVALPAGCANERRTHPALQAQRQATVLPAPLPEVELAPFVSGDPPLVLSSVRGPVVLNLWASWCAVCVRELPLLQEFSVKHPKVKVIGVDYRDRQPVEAARMIKEAEVSYDLFTDAAGDLDGAKPLPRLKGLPFTALIDANGEVVHQEFVAIDSLAQLEEMVADHLGREALS